MIMFYEQVVKHNKQNIKHHEHCIVYATNEKWISWENQSTSQNNLAYKNEQIIKNYEQIIYTQINNLIVVIKPHPVPPHSSLPLPPPMPRQCNGGKATP